MRGNKCEWGLIWGYRGNREGWEVVEREGDEDDVVLDSYQHIEELCKEEKHD